MAKLTKDLRDRCVLHLRQWADAGGVRIRHVSDAADALAACEVEAETVMWCEAYDALFAAGWKRILWVNGEHTFVRGDRVCYVWSIEGDAGIVITKTRYCPTDLLDGRLAALNEEVSRGK
jgi:hypothetical protein